MTNKKNEHVLYLEERIELLEESMEALLTTVRNMYEYSSPPIYKPPFKKLLLKGLEIQSKLPSKEIDKLDSDGGEA